jgi:tetratricopeptide (TPR) repeat protein
MKCTKRSAIALGILIVLWAVVDVSAQWPGITLPPHGDNQRAIATQFIGPIRISIDYHSPDVHAPDGSDRRGKIWGDLVPYGMADLNYGFCGDQCPWRGGANENTVFTISHDVKIQDKPLKSGSYGLHFIPGEKEWIIVFSNDSTSWGSYAYDASKDALRITAEPEKSEYHEWLTYEFTNRYPDRTTAELKWEDLKVPFEISVENIVDVYIETIAKELSSASGFNHENWVAAAQYCLQTKSHLDLGLKWAEIAAASPSYGVENYLTLSTLSELQEANGLHAEAQKTMERALNHYSAGPRDIYQYARTLQGQKKSAEAIKIFDLNAKRYPNTWLAEIGLARAYSAKGNYKEALKHIRLAQKQIPNEQSRKIVDSFIEKLSAGKDIN